LLLDVFQIAALKEQNADLSQQLELSDVQVQQLTDKYKSLVERKVSYASFTYAV